jgi:cyclic pyranopterin phosphate synthase
VAATPKSPSPDASGALIDARQRPLRDVRISLTDHCNLRCRYCMPKERFGAGHHFLPTTRLLSFAEITSLLRVLARLGARKVKLTGGEPLLRPEVPALVRMLRAVAPELQIALITNGVRLAPQLSALRAAGLDRVTVSLDTLQPQRFAAIGGRGAELDRVLAAIDQAVHIGFRPVKLNMVVVRGINDDEVEAMATRFRSPDTILRFIEYMDVGTTNGWRRDQVVPAAEILARLRRNADVQPCAPAAPGETAIRYRYADGSGEVGFIASVTQPFCGDCNRLRVSADGKLYTCLFAARGLDIRPVLRGADSEARLSALLTSHWQARLDQYSVERLAVTAAHPTTDDRPAPRIEMSYIGG